MKTKSSIAKREALGLHHRLQKRRQQLGLSLEDIAQKLGIHVTTYLRIEKGHVGCSVERAAELADLLNVRVATLYGEAA